jgi:hypothetical protein
MLATIYTFEVEPAGQRIERSVEQVEPTTLAAREQVWVADLGATLINSSATFREYVTRGRPCARPQAARTTLTGSPCSTPPTSPACSERTAQCPNRNGTRKDRPTAQTAFATRLGAKATATTSGTWKAGATKTPKNDASPRSEICLPSDAPASKPLGPERSSAGALFISGKAKLQRTNCHQFNAGINFQPGTA